MASLAVEAQDGTKSSSELADYDAEFTALAGFITDAASKQFNGVTLFASTGISVTTDGTGATFSMTGVNLSASAYTNATGASISSTSLAGPNAWLRHVSHHAIGHRPRQCGRQ